MLYKQPASSLDSRLQESGANLRDVRSGARVLDILEFFLVHGGPAREVDIRMALHLPKSSTNDLLKTLLVRGLLTFNSKARINFPSFCLVKFGSWLSNFYFG